MMFRKILLWSIVTTLLGAGVVTAVLTRTYWHPRLFPQQYTEQDDPQDDHHDDDRIKLSKPAFDSIDPQLHKVVARPYPRTLQLSGKIVNRPGQTHLKITTPITGVIETIHAFPGETVEPGDKLFTLHLHYHEIHQTQAELYKVTQQLQINKEEQQRLERAIQKGAISEKMRLDLEYQQRKLKASLFALKANLKLHRFNDKQIADIADGKFVDERIIVVPDGTPKKPLAVTFRADGPTKYEVGDLFVKRGDQVTAGKTLCELANHKLLYVEARVFPQDIPTVQSVMEDVDKTEADILNLAGKSTSKSKRELEILYMDQHIDPASQTAGLFLVLNNEFVHSYARNGGRYLLWKYRPGQRVQITLPIGKFESVYVLPREGVVFEGAEAYAFRENGDVLQRIPVRVLYKDGRNVVLAKDGILPIDVLVHHGASQIQRALKLQASGGGGGHHHHHH